MRFNFLPFNLKIKKALPLRFLSGIFANVILLIPVQSAPPMAPKSTALSAPIAPLKNSSPEIAVTSIVNPAAPVNSSDDVYRKSVRPESTAQIRVQIARSTSEMTIAASTDAVIRVVSGTRGRVRNHHAIAKLQANQLYSVLADRNPGGGLQIGATSLPNKLSIDSGSGAVWIGGRWYEGQVQLVNTGSELFAINQIDLERYLYSVVGSEMYADWQFQALKAQAVAARSYAAKFLEHPVSDWFDIGSDEAFQSYKGLESVTASTVQAVEETRGQVLVRNNQILLSEYAASDALTQSAHQGQGMSQEGAQARADQGWSYLEILGAYYRNAAVASLHGNVFALLPKRFTQ